MTDDSDNTRDLVLEILKDLQARLGRVEERLGGVEGRLGLVEGGLGQMAKELTEMQIAVAAIGSQQNLIRADVAAARKSTSDLQNAVRETQKSNAGRLNIIDGRLATIEGHFGIADA